MKEVRLLTNVRRMRPLKVYVLEPSVSAVPCQSDGIAREDSFDVSLFLSENNRDRQPAQAHMRYVRCKGASCEAAVESGVSVSSVTVNTGRAESKAYDKFIIQAYTPASSGRHEVVLATLHVSTVRDGEQGRPGSSTIIVPYGSWQAGRKYRSTEDVKIFVERHEMYYVLIRLNEDCLNIDPATDVKNEWWRLMDYVEYMFVNAMVADFGKIASTVFVGNHTISQHGIGPDGSPVTTESGYKDFGKVDASGKPLFRPNVLIDWLTGRIEALEMIIKGNSVFGGMLDGTEGSFRRLECVDGKGRKIVITPSPNGVDNPSVVFFNTDGKKVIGIEMEDDPPFNYGTVELTNYDSAGNQTNYALLHSNGIMKLMQPDKQMTATPAGITFSKPDGSFWKDSLVYPDERKVLWCNGGSFRADITNRVSLIVVCQGANHIYLPKPSEHVGRCIYFKNIGGSSYVKSVSGGVRPPSDWAVKPEYGVGSTIAYAAVSDGENWNVFFCG